MRLSLRVAPVHVESALGTQSMEAAAQQRGICVKQAERNAGIPMGRPAQASEVAAAFLYLASPAASYTRETWLDVNGGALLS